MTGCDGGKFLRGRVRGDARTARRGNAAQVPLPRVRIFSLFVFLSLEHIVLSERKEKKR